MKNKKPKKIAIITEFLYFFGGIEKCILSLVKVLNEKGIQTDIYAGLYDSEKTFKDFKGLNIKSFRKERLPSVLNTLYLRYKFRRMKLDGYDGFIIFGSHSIASGKNNHPNVWWSTRPLAYLYGSTGEAKEELIYYLHKGNIFKRFLMKIYFKILKKIDKKDIKELDEIKAVGVLAREWLKKAYPSEEIGLLFQPVDLTNYKYLSKGKYYLNVARHVSDKNVDKVILAFQKMPNKILYQVGEGPDGEKIKNLAKGHKNIKLLGFQEEENLRKIIGKSIAMISAAEDEDYSMNLIESIASGKPTISVNLDRSKKHMEKTKTGILIPSSDPNEIKKAVESLDVNSAEKMKKYCEERSKVFSDENFARCLVDSLGYGI